MLFKDSSEAYSYLKRIIKHTDLKVITIRRKKGEWGFTIGHDNNNCCDYYIRPKTFKTVRVFSKHNNCYVQSLQAANYSWISFNWLDMEIDNKLCRKNLEAYANKFRKE